MNRTFENRLRKLEANAGVNELSHLTDEELEAMIAEAQDLIIEQGQVEEVIAEALASGDPIQLRLAQHLRDRLDGKVLRLQDYLDGKVPVRLDEGSAMARRPPASASGSTASSSLRRRRRLMTQRRL